MTNEKAIMCLEDMKIKVPIPKAAKQARENNEALDVAIKALRNEPHWIPSAQPEIVRCEDCDWWTRQKDGCQGRCALTGSYPTGEWFCGNAKRREVTT